MTSYIRESDGALMVEVSPGCFVANKPEQTKKSSSDVKYRLEQPYDTNEDRGYFYLFDAGDRGLLADEAIAIREEENGDGKPAVNQVAPIFSRFKKYGIAIWKGKRPTRLGSIAHVHVLVANARDIFRSVYGRFPKLLARS